MDQVAALHWIAENIEKFGGNPSSVTIMGEGHGAACVNLLMLSPMARGKGVQLATHFLLVVFMFFREKESQSAKAKITLFSSLFLSLFRPFFLIERHSFQSILFLPFQGGS